METHINGSLPKILPGYVKDILLGSCDLLPPKCRAISCLFLILVDQLRLIAPRLDYMDNSEVGEFVASAWRYSLLACSEPLIAG